MPDSTKFASHAMQSFVAAVHCAQPVLVPVQAWVHASTIKVAIRRREILFNFINYLYKARGKIRLNKNFHALSEFINQFLDIFLHYQIAKMDNFH